MGIPLKGRFVSPSRMKKGALLAVLFVLASLPTRAQPVVQAGSTLQEDVRELIEITGAAELGAQVGEQMLMNLRPVFDRAYPNVPARTMNELFDEMRTELGRIDMVALVGPIYERHFTQAEIRGLIAFYKTPLGQRTIEMMPVVTQESMAAGQEWGRVVGRQMADRVRQRLQERGYRSSAPARPLRR
ncbi:MAG: DUF2059 domain-containing protein [Bacteroidetes bacterium]|nr:DUF2059 domain-containing protein [Bacteroidota bacterium]